MKKLFLLSIVYFYLVMFTAFAMANYATYGDIKVVEINNYKSLSGDD